MMKILERLGLAPKHPRPVSIKSKLNRNKEETSKQSWLRVYWAKLLMFVVITVIGIWAFPKRDAQNWGILKVGEVWRHDDVIAQEDMGIYRTPAELAKEQQKVLSEIEPIFTVQSNPHQLYEMRIDSLRAQFQQAFLAFEKIELARSRGQTVSPSDTVRYFKAKNNLKLPITELQWSYLLESAKGTMPGLAATTRATSEIQALDDLLLNALADQKEQLLFSNSIDVSKDSIRTATIVVRNNQNRTEAPMRLTELVGFETAETAAKKVLNAQFSQRSDTVAIGLAFFKRIYVPSFAYNRDDTNAQRSHALQSVSTTRGFIKKDQVVMRQGELITEESLMQLQTMQKRWEASQGNLRTWRLLLGDLFATWMVLSIFILYLFLYRRIIFQRDRHLWLVFGLFAIFFVAFGINVRLNISELVIPTAILSILLAISFDSRVGLFATVTLACMGGMIFNFDLEILFHILISGMIAVYSVRDIRNRGQFITTAGLVLFTNLLVALTFYLLQLSPRSDLLNNLLFIGINAVLTLMVYPLIWIVERSFDVTTDLTLLELLDTNHPLLKELSLRAPGTFSHSLQVANLAEAACTAVGGNSLLMRVGALYHDVGKMAKPEYYVENQALGMNPMDGLTSRMGALVVINHVKEGLAMAEEYRLPKVIRDFVPMHHGTMRVEYFYRKALAERNENDHETEPLESDFRYQGPKPATLETGILMLADGVEAACKSLEKPTLRRLEATIDKIIEARIADKQLENCPITFFDITKIKEAFLSVLGGMYHFRVKYPGQDEEEKMEQPTDERKIIEEEPASPTIEAPTLKVEQKPDTNLNTEERSTLS